MDKFEEKEIPKKRTVAKDNLYDWRIDSRAHKKTVGSVKDKIMSLFKTNTTKEYSKSTLAKNVYGGEKKPRK